MYPSLSCLSCSCPELLLPGVQPFLKNLPAEISGCLTDSETVAICRTLGFSPVVASKTDKFDLSLRSPSQLISLGVSEYRRIAHHFSLLLKNHWKHSHVASRVQNGLDCSGLMVNCPNLEIHRVLTAFNR